MQLPPMLMREACAEKSYIQGGTQGELDGSGHKGAVHLEVTDLQSDQGHGA